MAIGEVILGAILAALFNKMASSEFRDFVRRIRIDVQINKWSTNLSSIIDVHTDAENRQTGNDAVKGWLKDMENLVYDLDDLIDELTTEALHRKLRENEASNSSVPKFIATCCTNFSLADLMFDCRIAHKLKEISGRLEDLVNRINLLKLMADVAERPYRTAVTVERSQRTSVVEKSEIYGRGNETTDILKLLSRAESSSDNQISVIAIVGMGGIGKTTLVQLVYNDVSLEKMFEVKAWARVSDKYDALSITETILKQVSDETCDNDDFVILQRKLKKNLSNKKFLVVLDDVWNEKYEEWNTLITPFHSGKTGSKIIVTTRLQGVARMTSLSSGYRLNVLSDTDALSLFDKHAFGAKNIDVDPYVRDIGDRLVRRCKNLPLAVMILGGHLRKILGGHLDTILGGHLRKILGGHLRAKDIPKEWENVLNSEVLPFLKLSYQYLKPELKSCFEYFALFPKDHEFEKSELVFLWMAEGLVKDLEEGNQHLDELVNSSLLQQPNTNISRVMMHGLLNDLAVSIAGDKCLVIDEEERENPSSTISVKVRHLSFIRRECESYHRISSVKNVQSLRTFLPLPIELEPQHRDPQFLSQNILLDIIPKLYCLRVLSLNGYSIYELPNAISNLKRLRYLDLTKTLLKCLPESLTTLINLLVLILRGCRRLAKLPARMKNLVNLRHLNIAETPQLVEIPQGIAQLKSLQTLSKMIVNRGSGMRLNELGNLNHLQGEISIVGLQNVESVQEAIDAKLTDKPGLNKIKLVWSNNFDVHRDERLELDVLDALKPHENISSLEIEFYGGAKLSSWIGDLSISKLAKISIHDCKNCTALPALGHLSFLTDLSIHGMTQVKEIGAEFYGNLSSGELPFQALDSLILKDMPQWENWLGVEGVIQFPKLRKFGMKGCPNLFRLPILSLTSVCELEVEECSVKVLNSMRDLTSLTQLKLKNIFRMNSIVKAFVQFPLALEKIEIEDCNHLVNLWSSDITMQRLKRVVVARCHKLLSIQEIGVLPRIDCLHVENCSSLEFMAEKISSCGELYINDCPSLKTMTLHECLKSLGSHVIYRWVNLNLTNALGSVHNFSSLTELSITGFDGVDLFPHGGLPTPNLRDLKIINSPNLNSLPNHMEKLRFLQKLLVENCPLLIKPFSQGNIPPHLTELSISNCGNLNPLSEWGLRNLTSLDLFQLDGGYPELDSFFEEDDQHYLLPPSLTRLHLSNLPKLEILSKGFKNLTSLQYLQITNCPKLLSLPMEDHLDRLWSLKIKDCLPLKNLFLKNKKDLCLKNRTDLLPIIAHIPQVEVDGRSIYEPDPCP